MSRASRAIDGFVAWCDEFVGNVKDNNGTSMPREFAEQLEFLREASVDGKLNIPDIHDEADVVPIIDELKYRLKPAVAQNCGIAIDLDSFLNGCIESYGLNTDPYMFASLPEKADGY